MRKIAIAAVLAMTAATMDAASAQVFIEAPQVQVAPVVVQPQVQYLNVNGQALPVVMANGQYYMAMQTPDGRIVPGQPVYVQQQMPPPYVYGYGPEPRCHQFPWQQHQHCDR